MLISFPIVILGSHLAMTVADNVPRFDIARNCRLDVAATAGLTVDQSTKSCVRDEQRARGQLQKQWGRFPAASRASCTAESNIGGTPSYVGLLTCLQMTG
jgi:hypothetical protein